MRDAVVSRRDFLESYDEPWVSCVKAKALGVMCAYNQARLLARLLAWKWGVESAVSRSRGAVHSWSWRVEPLVERERSY